MECDNCGEEIPENGKFCIHCGMEISLKSKISGFAQRVKFQTKEKINEVKSSLDMKISQIIADVENQNNPTIAGISIPPNRQESVKRALSSIRDKYLDGNPTQTEDYQDWVDALPQRLEEHNCIVCFGKWDINQDEIVICPECQTGGHKGHIENWIRERGFCPLCRASVKFADFIAIVNSES